MFPLAFVDIYEGQLNAVNSESPRQQRRSKFRWWEKEEAAQVEVDADNDPYFKNLGVAAVPPMSATPEPVPATISHDQGTAQTEKTGYQTTPDVVMTAHQSHDTYGYSVTNTSGVSSAHVSSADQSSSFKKSHRRTGSYTQENTRSHDASVIPYARTLYPFIAENANEITFSDSEIVTLVQHIDEQWIEGELDGQRGLFPASYVEIIVDCPWSEGVAETSAAAGQGMVDTANVPVHVDESYEHSHESQSSPVQSLTSCDANNENNVNNDSVSVPQQQPDMYSSNNHSSCSDMPVSQAYGSMLYDYKPEGSTTGFVKGDIVNIVNQLDCDWFMVESEGGQRAMCPVSYVDILSVCPIPQSSAGNSISNDVTAVNTTSCEDNAILDANQNVSAPYGSGDISIETESGSNPRQQLSIETGSGSNPRHQLSSETRSGSNPRHQLEACLTEVDDALTQLSTKPNVPAKPKPAIKPKPSPKPKLIGQQQQQRTNTPSPTLKKPERPARPAARTSSPALTPLQSNAQISPKTQSPRDNNNHNSMTSSSLTPPKRPANSPKLSVFSTAATLGTNATTIKSSSTANLDDIISSHMQIAKAEAATRVRAGSTGASSPDVITPPPIPDRKNVPKMTRSLSDSKSSSSMRSSQPPTSGVNTAAAGVGEKRVSFATFYTGSDFTAPNIASKSQNIAESPHRAVSASGEAHAAPMVPVPRRRAPPRPAALKPTGNNLIEFSPEKERTVTGNSLNTLGVDCNDISHYIIMSTKLTKLAYSMHGLASSV